MLLEELATADLAFLAKTLGTINGLDGWATIPARAYNAQALKEAVALYNWSLSERDGYFIDHARALSFIVASSAMGTTRNNLFLLAPTGFIERNPLIQRLQTEAIVGDASAFKAARSTALPFISATRHLFYTLKALGDVATSGTPRYEAADGLSRRLAAGALRKLGIKGDSLFVSA